MTINIHPGMSFGDFLCQDVTDEEWDLMDPPPVAPPQNFIGPRVHPPKFLRCDCCDEWIQISDKNRRAKTARHGWCTPKI